MSRRKVKQEQQQDVFIGQPKDETALEGCQSLSAMFKEKKLRLSEDKFSVWGTSNILGYQTILAQHSATSGKWYFEATVEELPLHAHVRIGWSTRRTRYDQPIGSDCFSFAVRDSDFAKISLGKRFLHKKKESHCQIKPGDTIGCFLDLPLHVSSPKNFQDPLTHYPNLLCDPETVSDPELFAENSSIFFSLNGQVFPIAFKNLVQGNFYPAISLFGKAKVRTNFGQSPFLFNHDDFRPATEMYVQVTKPKKRPPNFIPRGLTSGATTTIS